MQQVVLVKEIIYIYIYIYIYMSTNTFILIWHGSGDLKIISNLHTYCTDN